MPFSTWDSAALQGGTLSNGNLTFTANTATSGIRAQSSLNSGKRYFEITAGTLTATMALGVYNDTSTISSLSSSNGFAVTQTGSININGLATGSTVGTLVAGDVLCFAVDLDAGLGWVRRGAAGNWNGNAGANPATGTGGLNIAAIHKGGGLWLYPRVGLSSATGSVTANFGASSFAGTVPSGFSSGWETGTAGTNTVSTKAAAEAWLVGQGTQQTTRVGYEAWFSIEPQAMATRAGFEAWFSIVPELVTTRVGYEAWFAIPAAIVTPPDPTSRRRRAFCVAG